RRSRSSRQTLPRGSDNPAAPPPTAHSGSRQPVGRTDPAQASMIIEKLILVDLLVDENLDDRRTSSEPPAPAGSTIRPHPPGRRTPEAGAGTFDNPPPPTAAHAPCRRPAGARHDPAPPTAQPGSAVRQPASQRSPAAQSGSQPAPAGCGAA